MARPGSQTDFNVPVEGIGTFTFAQRKMADEIAIQVEYARLINGVQPTEWLAAVAGWISTLTVLTVRAPDGWDIGELDPLDEESYGKLSRVHDALANRERSFRSRPSKAGEAAGSGNGWNGGVLVPPQVPADGNGSALP